MDTLLHPPQQKRHQGICRTASLNFLSSVSLRGDWKAGWWVLSLHTPSSLPELAQCASPRQLPHCGSRQESPPPGGRTAAPGFCKHPPYLSFSYHRLFQESCQLQLPRLPHKLGREGWQQWHFIINLLSDFSPALKGTSRLREREEDSLTQFLSLFSAHLCIYLSLFRHMWL